MEAIIFDGGEGKRLRPLTNNIPKALIKVGGRPILYWQLRWLYRYRITDVLILGGYKGKKISNYIKETAGFYNQMNIRVIIENKPLGTGGALKQARKFIESNTFYTIVGDVVTNINIRKLRIPKDNMVNIAITPLYSDKGVKNQ